MTDDASTPTLPISATLAAFLATQRATVADNPIGSQTRSLGQNIDAIFATLEATVEALRALELEVAQLKNQ